MAVAVFSSPRREHKPYREFLFSLEDSLKETLGKNAVKGIFQDPEKMAMIMSLWGWNHPESHISYRLFPEDIDFETINSFAPFIDKAWPFLLREGKSHHPEDSYFWEAVLDNCPLVRKSHDAYREKAEEQNEERRAIIEAQWPEGLTVHDFSRLYGDNAKYAEPYLLQETGNIPAWWLNLLGPGNAPRNTESHWKKERKVRPPARLYTSLGAHFLAHTRGASHLFLETFKNGGRMAQEILLPEQESVLLGFLRGVNENDFLELVKESFLDGVTPGGINIAEHFVFIRKVRHLPFATTLHTLRPKWFDNGQILRTMVDNGLSKEEEAVFMKMRLEHSFKEKGIDVQANRLKRLKKYKGQKNGQ